jgi:[acyl-carrier-protein] S-malonyltransferase
VMNSDEARQALTEQVTGTVNWVGCVKALVAAGTEVFIEAGPGKVLTGLLRQIDRNLKCVNVEDPASLEKAMAALAEG